MSAQVQTDFQSFQATLHEHAAAVDAVLAELASANIVQRIWDHDFTVWRDEPTEISNRLGWLRMPGAMPYSVDRMDALKAEVIAAGYRHVLLLGMGGSSLAPEVFARTFGPQSADPPSAPALELEVQDSTHPDSIHAQTERLDPAETLFIVSTKSGGTVETLSFFKYFYNWTAAALGEERAGEHFVAITDPGSKLVGLARKYQFRDIFLNDPTIGGRYSALTFFGLTPATLVGVDVPLLLARAREAMHACARPDHNPGLQLGAILGELARAGRDKLTFITPPALASFGDWVEQLIAESTGKEGKGILPVVGEPLGPAEVYGSDRLFVQLRLQGDDADDAAVQALADAGHPLLRMTLRDRYDLGAQFFLWEMATAVAGQRLDIQPFNQPNVESAKVRAREMVQSYEESGALPQQEPAFAAEGVEVYGQWPATRRILRTAGDVLLDFVDQAGAGDYISLQAYVPATPEVDAALAGLRLHLRRRLHLATTLGYGPRFLHSTGQLHKGDGGNGLFLQFTAGAEHEIAIPDQAGSDDSAISFGVLILSQALGDREALLDAGRRVLRFHLEDDIVGGVNQLLAALD